MRKLSILHLNTERTFRGGEIQTLLLVRQLNLRGYKNVLCVQEGAPLARKAGDLGLDTIELKMRGEWDLPAAGKLKRLIRIHNPDILHAHTPHGGTLALLARGRKKLPAIVLSRRVSFPLRKNVVSRYKYRSMDGILAVSRTVRQQLIDAGLRAEKVFVGESATDFSTLDDSTSRDQARSKLMIPADSFVIGNIGHFDRDKGQDALIEWFDQLSTRSPERQYFLLLGGEGPCLIECKQLAKRLNRQTRILFAGYRSDVQILYAAMDLFFLASPLEGFSGVLREAMGFGLPVITVRQDAVYELVSDGETGLLVSGDEKREWVEAIERLYNQPDLRNRLGLKAREFARQFTPQRLADKTVACYDAVLRRA